MCACSIRFSLPFSLRILSPCLSPVPLSRCVRSFVFAIPPSAIPPPRPILYRTPHSPCFPFTFLAEQRPSFHLSCLALPPLPDAKGSECSVHALSLSRLSVLWLQTLPTVTSSLHSLVHLKLLRVLSSTLRKDACCEGPCRFLEDGRLVLYFLC